VFCAVDVHLAQQLPAAAAAVSSSASCRPLLLSSRVIQPSCAVYQRTASAATEQRIKACTQRLN